jgi:signal transduction histidine kinase
LTNDPPQSARSIARLLAALAGPFAMAVGVFVLAGWQWDIEFFKRLLPGLVSMNPVTAVAFILAGWSLHQQREALISTRPLARLAALAVLAIGATTLWNTVFGWNLDYDQFLFASKLAQDGTFPNRMAPNTALMFALTGLALLLLDTKTRRGFRPAEPLALAAVLIALLALIGYGYRVQWLYGVAAFIPMALHTAVLFLVLSLGVLGVRPDSGLMALVTGDSPGGALIRTLFPLVVAVQFVLGWLNLLGGRLGLYGTELGVALLVSASIVVFAALLGWSAWSLHRTDRAREREAAARQRQSVALAEINRELEAFAYSVSHDLRSPLRHIRAYADLLQGETAGRLSDPARRHLAVIREAGEEMSRLIDDLLAFSCTARVALHQEPVALSALVAATVRGLEMETRDRNVVWRVQPLPEVTGDASLLRQVLANLLGNAIKYTRGRDPAVIEVGRAGRENDRLVFFVRDNGAGFDPRHAHRLFGVFQRLHRAEEFEGTGIGLALVRRVIARHGGRTWAEGTVNGGATFYFTLAPAADSASATTTPAAARRFSARILPGAEPAISAAGALEAVVPHPGGGGGRS